jgi:predicted transposase YbfD/YdcC
MLARCRFVGQEAPVPARPALCIADCFADLVDPRVERTKRHRLLGIVTVALCGVVCGAESWVEIEAWGEAKLDWLRAFLDLPHGIPSHDTFGRVFAALDPAQFEAAFLGWVQGVATATAGEVVAIDGKTARGAHDRANGTGPLHLVSAWAATNRLVLGQVAVDEKSNEITAIPALLDVLALEGCVVTIDAIGCQTAIAAAIVAKGAEYVLALKGNQERLLADVGETFALVLADPDAPVAASTALDKGHGRIEVRRCWAIDDPAVIAWLDPDGAWPGLRSIAMVEGERRIGATVTRQTRYYLSSLSGNAAAIAAAVRGHWGIENQVHWVLDVAFREDANRSRSGHSAENLAVLRRLALNLLRREPSRKVGIKASRLKAGWDNAYLLRVLGGQ